VDLAARRRAIVRIQNPSLEFPDVVVAVEDLLG